MKLTRRQLAAAALASPMMAQSGSESAPAELNRPGLDPVEWTRQRHRGAPLKLTFQADNRKAAESWQKKLRPKIAELVGSFPDRTPIRAEIVETREFSGYRRERVLFESRPGVLVSAYLLKPAKAAAPSPVIVCVPGHGRGADDIVGIDDKGRDRTDKAGYQHDFALQVVEQGVVALAIEPMAFGCRRDAIAKKRSPTTSSCQPSAGAALLLGETMIGWRVWDVMRAIDFVESRPDLDAKRVGCVGISGGGTCTLFSAALDTRIRAAMVSGYLNTFRDSILSLSHCIDNYVPGILQWAEMYDVAGLIAPRALFAESGMRDRIFPIAAFRESYAKVEKIYGVFGASDRLAQEVFDDEHVFHGAKGIPFLVKQVSA